MGSGGKGKKEKYSNKRNDNNYLIPAFCFLLVIVIALLAEKFSNNDDSNVNFSGWDNVARSSNVQTERSSGGNRPVHPSHQPKSRPTYKNEWSDWVGSEAIQEENQTWKSKMPGKFKTRVWLSNVEEHLDPNIRKLPKDLKNWEPGHMGTGISLAHLNNAAEEKRSEMFQTHAFEEFASEIVSLDRELPDWRGQWCKDTYDKNTEKLPSTSIIICFHNEAWSTLLRTVHSVINRTPDHLLKEILLIDDQSSLEHLGDKLDEYMKRFPKVRIVHLSERHGLMRSRMVGIKESKGEVLTFLDSHIEASIGWIEPLLHRIHESPKTIISPVIDAINDTSLYYTFIHKDLYGLMNWRMDFEWRELSPQQRAQKSNIWEPHQNPIMAGGLFSINKKWFEKLGYYDEGMSVWGGENYELSFKVWMCGGNIEISPCSRVGHIYRSFSPYKVTDKDINRNGLRVADVWMDSFKYLYYDRLGNFDQEPQNRLMDYGDVTAKKKIRSDLKCKSFKWFLDNICYGQLPYHDLIGAGEIRNEETGLCLDKNDRTEYLHHTVDLLACHNMGGHQYWWMNANRFIMRDYTCLGIGFDGTHNRVIIDDCRKSGSWTYNPETKIIKHTQKGGCMTLHEVTGGYILTMTKCETNNPKQKWEFTKYNKYGIKYPDLL